MRDVDLALSEISDIRAQMAANTRFLGISPGFNALFGFVAIAVAFFQSNQPLAGESGEFAFIAVWASLLVAFAAIISVEAVSRSRRLHGKMAGIMLKNAWQKVMPFFVAAVTLSWVICSYAPESMRLLPGLWQILVGLLGFAVLSNVPRELVWVAIWYFLCGIVVLALAGHTGGLSPWMMGIPLFIGQVAAAVFFTRAKGGISVYKV